MDCNNNTFLNYMCMYVCVFVSCVFTYTHTYIYITLNKNIHTYLLLLVPYNTPFRQTDTIKSILGLKSLQLKDMWHHTHRQI